MAQFLGRRITYTYEVQEIAPGERFVMSTAQGPFPMQTTYSWQDTESGGTRMTLRNSGEPSGFGKMAAPMMAAAMRKLGTAHEMFIAMGIEGFAERARRELAATGATARKRSVETSKELTAQEAQIARLARDGLSNPEIGAELFLSARTVEWHLRKVFTKLGITSRRQLRRALTDGRRAVALA